MPEMWKGDLNVFKIYKNLVYSIYNINFSTGHLGIIQRITKVNMATEPLYPIQIPSHEQDIVKRILFDRKDRIPSFWKQFTDSNNEIHMTIRENGFMIVSQ